MIKHLNIRFHFSWFLLVIIFSDCAQKNESADDSQIMVNVGTKQITRQEFIRRSEFAIRPPYCRDENYIHKKIILNSLIAEKLLAMEAGEVSDLTQNPDFQAYIEGRKEQAMRQIHYNELAYKTVKLNSEEIQREFDFAGRTYRVSYFTAPTNDISMKISQKLESENISFEEMYHTLTGDTSVPEREIKWNAPEETSIKDVLFKEKPTRGQIIGPVKVDEQNHLFLKVNGWTDQRVMTENDIRDRRQLVVDQLKNEKAWAAYETYVSELMHNKQMQFSEDTFKKLVTVIAPVYLNSEQTKKQMFNNSFWKNKETKDDFSHLPETLAALDHLPFFSVDSSVWTVGQFRSYMKRHPLVFRKEGAQNRNFAEQFRLAVADMVRDYYITQDAYEKGFDESAAVQQNVAMWRDHLLSLYQKYKYLESMNINEKDQMKIVTEYMTPYVDSLQIRYSAHIEINMPEFEAIKLTAIDMVALQPDQPFQIVVPSFPLVTTDHRLDYGKVME